MRGSTVTLSIDVPLATGPAFERVVAELTARLGRGEGGVVPMLLEAGPRGRVLELRGDDRVEVGEVSAWLPGERVSLAWRPVDWDRRAARTEVEIRFEAVAGGTRLTFEHRGWGAPILAIGSDEQAGGHELLGWFADQVLGPSMLATGPWRLGEWLTDRRARRPTGPRARETYRDPKEHRPGFRSTLAALALRPDDILLEVGCGGGAFIREALRSGCRAVAVDHSDEMVRLTRESNAQAVSDGRLDVVRASAEELPFGAGTFTCAAMTHVFFFLQDPAAALRECRRVLVEGGRLAVYTAGAGLRGTPGAPEPIVRWMNLFEPHELEALAHGAGLGEVGVSDEGGAHLLTARA